MHHSEEVVVATDEESQKQDPSSSCGLLRMTIVFSVLNFLSISCSGADKSLVDVQKINPRIRFDIRYATSDNFMKEPLYAEARCFLRPEVAEKISRIQGRLEKKGLGLKIFDGYRPLSVQKKMWARFPVEGYIANPVKGSNHNRGAAVDLTLVDSSGNELPMPSAYDEFSERSHRDYMKTSPEAIKNRSILEEEMAKEGFKGISTEWWHFDDKEAKKYPVLDVQFSEL